MKSKFLKNAILVFPFLFALISCRKPSKEVEPVPSSQQSVCLISQISGLARFEYDSKGNLALVTKYR